MIHQAKSNPQSLDERIFSERLASAISAIGTSRHFGAMRNLVAIGATRRSTKPRQSAKVPFTSGLPLPKRLKEFSKAELRAQLAEAVRNTGRLSD